jgi:UDP-N-acetylglucosamine 2-epimerase (non-hydrolysing)
LERIWFRNWKLYHFDFTSSIERDDEEQSLIDLLEGITDVGDKKIIFPIHPRTKAILGEQNLNLKKYLICGTTRLFEFYVFNKKNSLL